MTTQDAQLDAATREVYDTMQKLGMSNEQILAATRTMTKEAAVWPGLLASSGLLTSAGKIPAALLLGTPLAMGYVAGRTGVGETSESRAQDIRTLRRSDEILSNLDRLLKSRERRLEQQRQQSTR